MDTLRVMVFVLASSDPFNGGACRHTMDTTHTEVSPPHTKTEEETLIRILMAEREACEKSLSSLHQQRRNLDEAIDKVHRNLEAVETILTFRNIPPLSRAESAGQGPSSNGAVTSATRKAFTPGNRGEKTPPRRQEYQFMSLMDAIKKMLVPGRTMNLKQIVDEIYEAGTKEQIFAAKNSLRSTIANGVKQHAWYRVSDGVYRGA